MHSLLRTWTRTWHYEMLDLLKFYILRTMTSTPRPSNTGFPPPPIVELTIEQEFKLKQIELMLETASREDIITVFMALQHQCFVLGNNVSQLVKLWPAPTITDPDTINEVISQFGSLFETKD